MSTEISPELSDPGAEVERIKDFIENQRARIGFEKAVIGLSGGIDSGLTAVLTKRALSPDRIRPVFLPESTTPERDRSDVEKLAARFDLGTRTMEVDDYLAPFEREFSGLSRLAKANVKARIRMTLLYTIANEEDGIVVGTGNRSEWLLGYFTKYGDGAADIAPILHLFKTEVKELARYLDLPESIIEKPPSAGLWDGQTDEEELGGSYDEFDRALYCLRELGLPPEGAKRRPGVDPEVVDRARSLMQGSEHKRKNPPGLERD